MAIGREFYRDADHVGLILEYPLAESLHHDGAGGVSRDRHRGASHVHETVYASRHCNSLDGYASRSEHHGHQGKCAARYARHADGGDGGRQGNGNVLLHREIHAAASGDEHARHAQVDGGAVHVDCGSKGQHEVGNLLSDAHPSRAFHIIGYGGHARRAGEGEHHGGSHLAEEVERAHASEEIDAREVDDECVNKEAEVVGSDEAGVGAHHLRTVGSHHGREHAEHADGCKAQDVAQYLLHDLVETEENLLGRLCLLAHVNDGEAQEQGDDDDLHHVGIAEGQHRVAGEHVNDLVHESELVHLNRFLWCRQLDEWEVALEEGGHHEAQRHGGDGGEGEVDERPDAELAHLRDVLHRDDARYDGEHHQWHHDKLQQVKEDDAEWSDIAVGNLWYALHQAAYDDGKDEGQEYLARER